MSRRIETGEIDEHEHVTLMDRITLNDGAYITQAAVTGVQLTIVGRRGVEYDAALDKTSVVFDTIQLNDYWTRDRIGYNVRYTLDTEGLMEGGKEYSVILMFETANFGPKYSQFRIKVRDVPGVG